MSFTHYITKSPKLGPVDAKVVYPVVILLIQPSFFTLGLFFVALLLILYLKFKNISIKMLIRRIRTKMIGKRRQIRSGHRKNLYL